MAYDDCFTRQAAAYARYRPRYPQGLIDFLASVADGRGLAWDCGAGNGQVALSLAEHFGSIIATDVNAGQIRHSFKHPSVSYVVGKAEQSGLRSGSVDLITVGNALHWFDVERFYEEASRVLKPSGVIAVFQHGFQKLGSQYIERYQHFNSATPPNDLANIRKDIESLIERKLQMFPDDLRQIVNAKVRDGRERLPHRGRIGQRRADMTDSVCKRRKKRRFVHARQEESETSHVRFGRYSSSSFWGH